MRSLVWKVLIIGVVFAMGSTLELAKPEAAVLGPFYHTAKDGTGYGSLSVSITYYLYDDNTLKSWDVVIDTHESWFIVWLADCDSAAYTYMWVAPDGSVVGTGSGPCASGAAFGASVTQGKVRYFYISVWAHYVNWLGQTWTRSVSTRVPP